MTKIGTSGWSYDHWIGCFYHEKLPKSDWLKFYAKRFSIVEVNSTFYRLPFKNIVKSWDKKIPEIFIFSIKGPKKITHIQKLKEIDEFLKKFYERIEYIKSKTSNILWQLPPSLKKDEVLLENFLTKLDKSYNYTIEFRDNSW
ncbi:DUF72 domain-containing protein [Thermosipho melanesiensis]|uniref:DUF72 domain-containing protein n=1 Tax=Thermosipho melanesiensis TaxID=46541 RepID=UPI0000ED33B0|nr:DUF72 domain-containing protein [Thermosipho melanesiensis]